VKPEIHVPDQRRGNISKMAFFPNIFGRSAIRHAEQLADLSDRQALLEKLFENMVMEAQERHQSLLEKVAEIHSTLLKDAQDHSAELAESLRRELSAANVGDNEKFQSMVRRQEETDVVIAEFRKSLSRFSDVSKRIGRLSAEVSEQNERSAATLERQEELASTVNQISAKLSEFQSTQERVIELTKRFGKVSSEVLQQSEQLTRWGNRQSEFDGKLGKLRDSLAEFTGYQKTPPELSKDIDNGLSKLGSGIGEPAPTIDDAPISMVHKEIDSFAKYIWFGRVILLLAIVITIWVANIGILEGSDWAKIYIVLLGVLAAIFGIGVMSL
jgi:hypothetical protein